MSGTRHEYVRDLSGVSQHVPAMGSSDGQMDSDKLLQYLIEQSAENTGSPYYFTVEYVGIYTHKTDYTLDGIMFLAGATAFVVSFIPVVREITWVSMGLNVLAGIDLIISGADLIKKASGPLSDKDYHQYHVTLQFTDVVQFNGEIFRTLYTVDAYYLWDDRSMTNPSWYLQKAVQTTFPLD